MADKFPLETTLEGPAAGAFAVTPSDSADLSFNSRALYIAGTGDVRVTMVNGDVVTFTAVPAGTVLPVRVKRVHSTSTTATNIVAMH